MRLDEGGTKNFSESTVYNELAIIDATDPEFDEVVAIPESILARGTAVQNPQASLQGGAQGLLPEFGAPAALPGAGGAAVAGDPGHGARRSSRRPLEVTYRQDERNTPTAYVELVGPEGSLGIWTVSTAPREPPGVRATRAARGRSS